MKDKHENVRAYTLALAIDDACYKLTREWKPFDRDTVGIQLIRATGSIGANIAEGLGREGRDPRRFAIIAQGSLRETRHWIETASLHGLLTSDQSGSIHILCDEERRELNNLIRALGDAKP